MVHDDRPGEPRELAASEPVGVRQGDGRAPEPGKAFGLLHVNVGGFLPLPTEEEESVPAPPRFRRPGGMGRQQDGLWRDQASVRGHMPNAWKRAMSR